MKKSLSLRLLATPTIAGTALSAASAEAAPRAFIGGTVIDGNGGKPIADGVVIIDGGKILAVGPSAKTSIPADAERIDVSGRYVLPGLMDANVHLVPWPSWSYIEFLARYENNFEGIIEEASQLALKAGFTTVFDSMGPLKPLMAVRDRINHGEAVGARMFVAGDIVGFRAVFTETEAIKSASKAFQKRINDLFEAGGGPDLVWKTPDQVYTQMRAYVAQGADFVKYGATGDGRPVNSEIGQGNILRFTPEQQRAIVKAAHDGGVTVQTHQGSAEALRVVVEAGNDMAQHCAHTGASRISDATIKLMLEKKFFCGTQWGPLSPEEERQVRENDFPGEEANGKDGVNFGLENSVRLIRAGVPHLVSTDAGTIDPDVAKDFPNGGPGGMGGKSGMIGEAEFIEMHAMRQRGMTPMQIIQAATKNIAAAYKKLATLGTLEPGKVADLVVVDADPLADIANLRKVSMVVKDGMTVDRASLPLKPILTSPEAVDPGTVRTK